MIEFRALGSTNLLGAEGNQLHSVLSRPKILSLLVALGVGDRGVYLRRETLLGLLWAETDPERARASLRQGIYTLRQSLGGSAILSRGEDELHLNPEKVWVDVWAFQESLERGELAEALNLYRGHLLEGFFPQQAPELERWLDQRRRELRERAAEGAYTLALEAARDQNPSGAGHWARRAAELGDRDEVLVRKCLEVFETIGDHSGASEIYHRLERTLASDFDLSPAPETQDLFRRLQVAHSDSAPEDTSVSSPPSLATTSSEEDHDETVGVAPRPGVESTGEKGRPWAVWLVAALVVVAAFATWAILGPEGGATSPGGSTDSREAPAFPRSVLAVLPFEGDGVDPGTDQFAAGVHQDILTELARISDLTVLSRRAVEPYRETDLGIREISSELGAGSILEGTVRWDADRVRVSVELTDAATRTQVWAGSYDKELSALLQAQRAVAQEVALALEATLSSPPGEEVDRFPDIDPQVLGLYLRALGVGGGWPTIEGVYEEELLLREALSLDSGFAAAWAALALNFARRPSEMGLSLAWTDSALVAANRALALDSELPEGYLARGTAHHAKGNLALALLDFDRAVALDPNLVEARHKRGFVLTNQGKLDRALLDQLHALRRDPNNAVIRVRTGRLYALLGDMEAAERMAREGIFLERFAPSAVFLVEAEMHMWAGHADAAFRTGIQMVQAAPEDPILRSFLADLAFQAGECETSATEARRALEEVGEPESLTYYFHAETILGFALRACGEEDLGIQAQEKARSSLMKQMESGSTLPLRGLELAALSDALGQRKAALDWIRWAYDQGSRNLGFLRRHPLFQSLRDVPEVQAIVDLMQADVDEMRSRISTESSFDPAA